MKVTFGASVLASTLLLLSVSAGYASAASSEASPIASVTCKAGVLLSSQELPDGGRIETFDVAGVVGDFPIPPAGWRPEKATDEDLDRYGFPPRPTDQEDLAGWNTEMSSWKGVIPPAPCTTGASSTVLSSSNWSGVLDTPTTFDYAGASANFTQPSIGSSACNTNNSLSSWVGIGGWGSQSLIQAGTARQTGIAGVHAFYEALDPTHQPPEVFYNPDVIISEGDSVHAAVLRNPTTGSTRFYVLDVTTGLSGNYVTVLPSSYYDPSHAEYVNERELVNGSYTDLYNFGTASWTSTQALDSTGAGHASGNLPHDAIEMDHGTTKLAVPDVPLSSSLTFTNRYYACR